MTTATTTDQATRAEVEQAITNHNLTLHRMPAHWTDRRASIHAAINNLLDQWEQATPRTTTPADGAAHNG